MYWSRKTAYRIDLMCSYMQLCFVLLRISVHSSKYIRLLIFWCTTDLGEVLKLLMWWFLTNSSILVSELRSLVLRFAHHIFSSFWINQYLFLTFSLLLRNTTAMCLSSNKQHNHRIVFLLPHHTPIKSFYVRRSY